ncbi:hypothetical protein LINGRAHAP2_LOCUS4692, partial [Linum grandiflorum]
MATDKDMEEGGWKVRKEGEFQPDYGSTQLFSFEINLIRKLQDSDYYNGDQGWIDHVDPDLISLVEIKHMAMKLGESDHVLIYWLQPGMDVSYGLTLLGCDNDVLQMVDNIPKDKIIKLYLKKVVEEDGHKVGQQARENVDPTHDEVGGESESDDDDYYPETDSDDSIVFEDDQLDPFDDKDFQDTLNKSAPAENANRPTPVTSTRVTRSKTKVVKGLSTNEGARQGGNRNRRTRFRDFNARLEMDRPELENGMYFGSFELFRAACKRHSINERRAVKFPKNDKERCYCVCKENCGFRIHARAKPKLGGVQIVQCNSEHDCGVLQDMKAATKLFFAQHYLDRFRDDPGWSTTNLIHTVKTDFKLTINRIKAYRTKVAAMNMIHGEYGQQFEKLFQYKAEIEDKNPGS